MHNCPFCPHKCTCGGDVTEIDNTGVKNWDVTDAEFAEMMGVLAGEGGPFSEQGPEDDDEFDVDVTETGISPDGPDDWDDTGLTDDEINIEHRLAE